MVTQDEFDKWLDMASSQAQTTGAGAAAPDPPDYTKCVAAKKKQPTQPGQPKPTNSALKDQCKQEYDTLKTQVMQFLIQSEWVQQEAEAQDVSVSDKEVRNSLEEEKKRAFPGDKNGKQYEEFLKSSGMSEKDVLFRIKLDQLQTKLTEKVTKDAKNVSDAEVEAYYDKNKKKFAQPERRDLLVVLTKDKAKAEQAKQALDDGQSWKQVVKKYSIDEASKAQGGKLPGVAKGQNEKALDDAIFAAKKGEVEGPVKTQFGWEVFEVDEDHARLAAVARGGQGHDREPPALAGPAEGAGQVHQGLPRAVQGRHQLRRGLPGGGVQERSEGEDEHRSGPRRPAAPDAAARRRRSSRRAAPQPPRNRRTSAARRGSPGRAPAARRDHAPAAGRVPLGPRAGRALDRASHDRGGIRARGRRPQRATTPSCSTSWATSCSRSTSWPCCSRSGARATSRRWPSTAARS